MNLTTAAVAALATFLLATAPDRAHPLAARLGAYFGRPAPVAKAADRTSSPVTVRRIAAAGTGAAVGVLAGLAGAGHSPVGMAAAGAGAGILAVNVAATRRRDHHQRALRQELPTVADALALHVLAGDSITTAMERFCNSAEGAAARELGAALEQHAAGAGLIEALTGAARRSGHPDAARLYETLAHAHHTGGRLADRLADLAADFRAGQARDLTAEGGRRALAVYAPIMALQIPVTLLFLIYPTLVGLGELSAHP